MEIFLPIYHCFLKTLDLGISRERDTELSKNENQRIQFRLHEFITLLEPIYLETFVTN